jgi:uncharacterized DUF497 family protein
MRIRHVDWPPGIRDKVERKHGLSQEDVESAVLDKDSYVRRARSGRYIVLGRAEAGSYIASVIVYSAGRARVISARSMTQSERRTHRQRGK